MLEQMKEEVREKIDNITVEDLFKEIRDLFIEYDYYKFTDILIRKRDTVGLNNLIIEIINNIIEEDPIPHIELEEFIPSRRKTHNYWLSVDEKYCILSYYLVYIADFVCTYKYRKYLPDIISIPKEDLRDYDITPTVKELVGFTEDLLYSKYIELIRTSRLLPSTNLPPFYLYRKSIFNLEDTFVEDRGIRGLLWDSSNVDKLIPYAIRIHFPDDKYNFLKRALLYDILGEENE